LLNFLKLPIAIGKYCFLTSSKACF